MPFYRLPEDVGDPGGFVHINFGRGKRARNAPRPCGALRGDGTACGWVSGFQCDWKFPGGRTCDRHLCTHHAREVALDKHLCPEHELAALAWALI